MKKQVTSVTCDKCGRVDVLGTKEFVLQTGWIPCPAGGSSQRDTQEFDLCPDCMRKSFMFLMNMIDSDKSLSSGFNWNIRFLKECLGIRR